MKKNNYQLPSLQLAKHRNKKIELNRENFVLSEHTIDLGKNKKYFIKTHGCQANERDSETICGIMDDMLFEQVFNEEEADVILINTCAIRKNAEDKVFGEIGAMKHLLRNNPNLIIGLCGCMAQEEQVVNLLLQKYPQVSLIFGTHNIHRLPDLLYDVLSNKNKVVEVFSIQGEVIEQLPVKRFTKTKAWVNIMYGCDKFCTYCIVPFTRGKERSRTVEDVLDEVKTLKAEGYVEVTLLGQNVNAYGKDLNIEGGFAYLLEEVAKIGIPRVRFTTSHPWDFSDEMIDVISRYDNIMKSIHLPVQSGNSDILKIMGRRYSVDDYKHLVDRIIKKIPNAILTTDIIVGFPNETEEQFQDTLDLYDYCQFALAYTFVYSPREGTPAAKMVDNVSEIEKSERLQRLNKKVGDYANKSNSVFKGKILNVLVDGLSKRNDKVYSGYSEENKLVNFTANCVEIGSIVQVEIIEAKTWSLDGIMVEKVD